jgi:hypothetical protein
MGVDMCDKLDLQMQTHECELTAYNFIGFETPGHLILQQIASGVSLTYFASPSHQFVPDVHH